ncbi:Carboxypeptidase [Dirofilaria immitis]|nr:Carboxypeptidase [Dirofilaria immitis]
MWRAAVLILLLQKVNTEEIEELPGTEHLKINFKHYSGYFQVSDIHHLHYWFVESQNDVVNDPLIFWFNGGPGCSSLDGILNEMGPYLISDNGKTLHRNPFAWNKMASIAYIESPAGVGYSYSINGNIKTNDDQTAEENYAAIKEFFENFPQFRNHSVYIMGESYGGIYVPTLTVLALRGLEQFPINLKGIALGNGYVNEALNIDTLIVFAYNHGLVDEKTWNTLEKECCHGCIDTCDLTNITGRECINKGVQEIFRFIWSGNLNPYDLYRDCYPNLELSKARMHAMKFGLTNIKPLAGDVPCLNDSALIQYMNSAEVRRALHIPQNLPKWDVCNSKITTNYDKIYGDMGPFIKEIIKANIRVLLYYGDTDMACNFMMGQQFSASLNLQRKRGKEPWIFNSQIAGFKTIYNGLIFLTIRGAGHMAPQWRAPQMQYVIQQFINNRPI